MEIGGGIITKKLLFAVLLISAVSLAGIAGASAAEVGTVQTQAVNNSTVQEVNTQSNVNQSIATQNSTDKNTTMENTSTALAATGSNQTTTASTSKNSVSTVNNTSTQKEAAAGTTKTATVTSTSFTVSQINDAAARVKAYIETNHVLPNYVTIGTTQVKMPDFLKLLTAGLLEINSGSTASITQKTVSTPVKPTESVTSGNITKANYIDLAKRVDAYINTNGVVPNYANSTLGKLRYESLIYAFSRILAFYETNKYLPNYVTIKPWSTVGTAGTSMPVPASLQQYLQATTNCQVNNAQIQALSKSITSGETSSYDKAVSIFNWVRDNLGYSFYYNSQEGAVGALNDKTANCCDTANLVVALERAAEIPAEYEHVYAQFSDGWYGHVIALVWVNGVWYNADATSSSNTFGAIKNWNTATATYYGTYQTIPF